MTHPWCHHQNGTASLVIHRIQSPIQKTTVLIPVLLGTQFGNRRMLLSWYDSSFQIQKSIDTTISTIQNNQHDDGFDSCCSPSLQSLFEGSSGFASFPGESRRCLLHEQPNWGEFFLLQNFTAKWLPLSRRLYGSLCLEEGHEWSQPRWFIRFHC